MLKQKVKTSNLVPLTDTIKTSDSFDEELVIGDLYELESYDVVRFRYTLAAIRNYKLKHGREFLNDYGKATQAFTELLKDADIANVENLTPEQSLGLVGMLSNPTIMNFVMDLIPCLYVEVRDGKFVQNEATIETAEGSDWLMDLVNLEFFVEIFGEITSNMGESASKAGKLSIAK